jgi:hypothetical protein
MLTMSKVHLYVIISDIGCHGNDWRAVELSDDMTSRNTIQLRHYDIHQDHVVLETLL